MKPLIAKLGINRVLSIFPSSKGFGYAVFESPRMPVDWGAVRVNGKKNKGTLTKIKQLIRVFKPDHILLRDEPNKNSHVKRIQKLCKEIEELAQDHSIQVSYYTRSMVKRYFKRFDAISKDEIARAIVRMMPEFRLRLPRFRKTWMSEDYRINLFDAISMVLAFYHFESS